MEAIDRSAEYIKNDYVLDMKWMNVCCLNDLNFLKTRCGCGRLVNTIERLQRNVFDWVFRKCVSLMGN